MALPVKPPGRPLGSKNKASRIVRDIFEKNGFDLAQEIIEMYLEHRVSDYKFAGYLLTQMLPYVYPKATEDSKDNMFDELPKEQQLEMLDKLTKFLKGKDG